MTILPVYLQGQAEGAIPNGKRIVKAEWEEGDGTPLGTLGTVLSSIRPDSETARDALAAGAKGVTAETIFYFVEWDNLPGVPVGILDWKIDRIEEAT